MGKGEGSNNREIWERKEETGLQLFEKPAGTFERPSWCRHESVQSFVELELFVNKVIVCFVCPVYGCGDLMCLWYEKRIPSPLSERHTKWNTPVPGRVTIVMPHPQILFFFDYRGLGSDRYLRRESGI